MIWAAVGVGGAIGSLARYFVSVAMLRSVGSVVPWAVAIVNLVGCLGIGVAAGAITRGSWTPSEVTRAFVFVGLFGGFTTFSSFGLDTFVLIRQGSHLLAATNAIGQLALGIVAVFAGHALAVRVA